MLKRDRILLVLQALSGLGALALYVYVSTYPYRIGLANTGGPANGFLDVALYWVGMLLLGLVYLLLAAIGIALAKRRERLLGVGLIGLLIAGALATRALCPGGYEKGFPRWVGAHIDEQPIVAWAESLPPVAVPAEISRQQWPPAITALAPATVEHHPTGIVLQWGVLAAWGTSRKVFIAVPPDAPAPDDMHHTYTQTRLGLWWAVQVPG